jgi:hypothetical protein
MAKNNRKTIFCDIDGTLVFQFPFDEFDENKVEVLPPENGDPELKPGDLIITGMTGGAKAGAIRPAGPRLF